MADSYTTAKLRRWCSTMLPAAEGLRAFVLLGIWGNRGPRFPRGSSMQGLQCLGEWGLPSEVLAS